MCSRDIHVGCFWAGRRCCAVAQRGGLGHYLPHSRCYRFNHSEIVLNGTRPEGGFWGLKYIHRGWDEPGHPTRGVAAVLVSEAFRQGGGPAVTQLVNGCGEYVLHLERCRTGIDHADAQARVTARFGDAARAEERRVGKTVTARSAR